MTRPPLHPLGHRRAPALHRTLPTWARERTAAGIEYRLYVPSINGIAVFTCDTFALDQGRGDVAALLRARRRMLWGRDRVTATPTDIPTTPAAAAAPPAPAALAQPAQGSLF
jgi:hypothetical protein